MSNFQVIIIGGGAMGCSLLYHLAKEGWRDILLLEKNDLTHGSTWHAAGLCTHFAHNPSIQELRATSVRLYRDILPAETGETCGFHRSGAMRITRNPDRMDEFAHVAGLSEFTGYPLELLTPQRISELHPLAQLDGLLGGIYEPDDGHVDPTLATNAMAKVAQQNGAQIHRYEPVHHIERAGGLWTVKTAKTRYRCQHLVNAAGTWGYEVGQMMGVNVPSVPVLHQYLVTDTVSAVKDRIADNLPELPIIRDPEESWYVRQERDGLILGPYEKDAQIWSVDGVPPEFGADLMPPDLDRVEHIIEAAMARIPALGTAGVKSVINGPITFSPDANPLIGPAHGVENGWLLTGSSMGVMEGGGAGWFLAHWMTHGCPPMDALAVDSRRFGPWADRNFRIDKAVECFGLQFGVHYPHEERPAGRNLRLSPLHDLMLERGAVMGAVHGWERPNWFSDQLGDHADESFRRSNWFEPVARECAAVSETAGLADLSVFSKFEVTGPDTGAFLDILGINRAPAPGRIGLTHVLTPAGGVLSEFTIARLSKTQARLTSASGAEEMDWAVLQERSRDFNVSLQNLTDEIAIISLMGPKSPDILREINLNLEDIPWMTAKKLTAVNFGLWAMRMSYVGEMGVELHVPKDQARALFHALEAAGKPYKLGLFGAYAMNAMRLEKGYPAWGADLTTERSALESGLGRFIHGQTQDLEAMQARPNDWQLVMLEIDSAEIDPFYAHAVYADGRVIGIVTSGTYGHRVGKALAMAWLREPNAPGPLTVQILRQRHAAKRLDNPPFDPQNIRLKG